VSGTLATGVIGRDGRCRMRSGAGGVGGAGGAVATVSAAAADGGGPRVSLDDSWGFPACEDVPELRAPPEAYRDSPVYVFDEMPKDVVKAWGRRVNPVMGGSGWIVCATAG